VPRQAGLSDGVCGDGRLREPEAGEAHAAAESAEGEHADINFRNVKNGGEAPIENAGAMDDAGIGEFDEHQVAGGNGTGPFHHEGGGGFEDFDGALEDDGPAEGEKARAFDEGRHVVIPELVEVCGQGGLAPQFGEVGCIEPVTRHAI
jgi:hypothetical protein